MVVASSILRVAAVRTDNINSTFRVRLGFTSPAEVKPDGGSGWRVPTRFGVEGSGGASDVRWCQATDLAGDIARNPGLFDSGFDQIDLADCNELQRLFEQVADAGSLNEYQAKAIRDQIQGRRFKLSGGRRVKVLFVAPEGFIMRQAGPDGMPVTPIEAMTERNGHRAADQVHADQNVYGTPLRQMLKGSAPWLFRHQTRGRNNRLSPIFLLNLWVPLQQCVQPLALADRRTVDTRRHQLHYSLPTDGFLAREKDQVLNDIWLFLHDEKQRWYCDTEMNSDRAYVFDTLGTPHGAATLPGEEVAAAFFEILGRLSTGAAVDLCQPNALPPLSPATPASLACVLNGAVKLFDDIRANPSATPSQSRHWAQQADTLRQRLVRKSLEMRLVALVY